MKTLVVSAALLLLTISPAANAGQLTIKGHLPVGFVSILGAGFVATTDSQFCGIEDPWSGRRAREALKEKTVGSDANGSFTVSVPLQANVAFDLFNVCKTRVSSVYLYLQNNAGTPSSDGDYPDAGLQIYNDTGQNSGVDITTVKEVILRKATELRYDTVINGAVNNAYIPEFDPKNNYTVNIDFELEQK